MKLLGTFHQMVGVGDSIFFLAAIKNEKGEIVETSPEEFETEREARAWLAKELKARGEKKPFAVTDTTSPAIVDRVACLRPETNCRGCSQVILAGIPRIRILADAGLMFLGTFAEDFCGIECAWNLTSIAIEEMDAVDAAIGKLRAMRTRREKAARS